MSLENILTLMLVTFIVIFMSGVFIADDDDPNP
jgi:hypothetical protein